MGSRYRVVEAAKSAFKWRNIAMILAFIGIILMFIGKAGLNFLFITGLIVVAAAIFIKYKLAICYKCKRNIYYLQGNATNCPYCGCQLRTELSTFEKYSGD